MARKTKPVKPQPPLEVQEGAGGRSPQRDERLKRAIKREPQREEPKADSVEPDELPPA